MNLLEDQVLDITRSRKKKNRLTTILAYIPNRRTRYKNRWLFYRLPRFTKVPRRMSSQIVRMDPFLTSAPQPRYPIIMIMVKISSMPDFMINRDVNNLQTCQCDVKYKKSRFQFTLLANE